MNPSVISSFKMAFYSHQPPFQVGLSTLTLKPLTPLSTALCLCTDGNSQSRILRCTPLPSRTPRFASFVHSQNHKKKKKKKFSAILSSFGITTSQHQAWVPPWSTASTSTSRRTRATWAKTKVGAPDFSYLPAPPACWLLLTADHSCATWPFLNHASHSLFARHPNIFYTLCCFQLITSFLLQASINSSGRTQPTLESALAAAPGRRPRCRQSAPAASPRPPRRTASRRRPPLRSLMTTSARRSLSRSLQSLFLEFLDLH